MDGQRQDRDRVIFGLFDPAAEVQFTQRNLPHWFQSGAATFVTFRTADSLPKEVVLRWQRELEDWLDRHELPVRLAQSTAQRRLNDHDNLWKQLNAAQQREFKRLSDRAFHYALDDCHGECLLRRLELARIVADALRHHDGKKYDLDRFVVMPNHVHVIVQFRAPANLKTVSQSWMRYTARKINVANGRHGTFWQPEPFDHIIRNPDRFDYLRRYVAETPKQANLSAGEYLYWEA